MGVNLLELPDVLEKRRQYTIDDEFTGLPPRQHHQYVLSDGAADADLAATIIFSPNHRVILDEITITPDGSAAGVDDSNTSVWTVTDGTNTIVTETYDSTTAFPADNTQTSLGTLAYKVIEDGGRVELAVTNGSTANLPAVVVNISYYDAESYPGPQWKVVATNDGTATLSDGVKGVLALSPGAADNDEIYLVGKLELFKFLANKPILFEAAVQFTEANTDDANIMAGVMDAPAANALVDDGAGPKASYSGAVLYKVDGGTVWNCECSVSTTQHTTASAKTAGGTAYQVIRIEIMPVSSTVCEVAYFVDGVQLADSNGTAIKHRLTYTNGTEMAVVFGVKNGGANAETLNVDRVVCTQLR